MSLIALSAMPTWSPLATATRFKPCSSSAGLAPTNPRSSSHYIISTVNLVTLARLYESIMYLQTWLHFSLFSSDDNTRLSGLETDTMNGILFRYITSTYKVCFRPVDRLKLTTAACYGKCNGSVVGPIRCSWRYPPFDLWEYTLQVRWSLIYAYGH